MHKQSLPLLLNARRVSTQSRSRQHAKFHVLMATWQCFAWRAGYGAVSGAYNYFAGFVTGATVSDVKKLRFHALETVSAYSTTVTAYLDAVDEADRELVAKYTNTVTSSLGSMDELDHELAAYPSGKTAKLFSTRLNQDVTLTLHRPLSARARARARHPLFTSPAGVRSGRTFSCNSLCNFLRSFFSTQLSAASGMCTTYRALFAGHDAPPSIHACVLAHNATVTVVMLSCRVETSCRSARLDVHHSVR